MIADVATPAWGLDVRPANATCTAFARPVARGTVKLVRAFTAKFAFPVAITQVPQDPNRFFIVEKAGRVASTTPGDQRPGLFADISDRVEPRYKESGLLGIAFHPRFAENGQVFLAYTAGAKGRAVLRSRVSRFIAKQGRLDRDSEQILIEVDRNVTYRLGGDLKFGPDGLLYATIGDASPEGVLDGAAQDDTTLRGKIVRLDVDRAGAKPEIFAKGLRSVWRMSFDRETGVLWAGDVGGKRREEIDRIRKGGNYGFDVREGSLCTKGQTCRSQGFEAPEVEYGHELGTAVVGGYVYRGKAMPALAGAYIYGDFSSGTIWALEPSTTVAARVIAETGRQLSAFGEDATGEHYVLDYGGGVVYRLEAANAVADPVPPTLSRTGCVDPVDPKRPAVGLIPYDVAAPLWSDGAAKARWIALPDRTTIGITEDGHFELPVGAVAMKTFSIGGKPVETRLLVRHDDGDFAGYSYEWRTDGKDADLLPAGKVTSSWTFPSRIDCMRCHTTAAGRILGLEVAQLDFAIDYPGGRRGNQLATFAHLGLLAATPPAGPRFPRVDDASAPLDTRVRAYLHANCAHCHRPGGPGNSSADLRFATPLSKTATCNAIPQAGELGIAGARVLVPGDHARSLLALRLRTVDNTRMPPLASRIVDDTGAGLVDAWIDALDGCP